MVPASASAGAGLLDVLVGESRLPDRSHLPVEVTNDGGDRVGDDPQIGLFLRLRVLDPVLDEFLIAAAARPPATA